MVRIWNLDRWLAYSTGQIQEEGMNPGVEGFTFGPTRDSVYQWRAWPNQHGWMVQVRTPFNAREETLQGATFNLGLEVVAACKRSNV